MADEAAQIEAYKAAANNYYSQLDAATTKQEALTLAIHTMENLMNAIKLASNPTEKKKLRSQFSDIANVAERIKSNAPWTPAKLSVPPQPAPQSQPQQEVQLTTQNVEVQKSKSEEIGQWAADVAQSNTRDEPEMGHMGFSSNLNTGITNNISPTSAVSLSTLSLNPTAPVLPESAAKEDTPRVSATNVSQQEAQNTDGTLFLKRPELHTVSTLSKNYENTPTLPSLASHSRIRRLPEPISSRKRTRKEEIILLKASIVNSFKCPPWDTFPKSSEFVLDDQEGMFTEPRDLSLSSHQQQFFRGWVRANEAMPPPSIFPGDKNNIGPLMFTSRPIDLVQDAATDCSVVASLCAGIARHERGHDQILSTKLYPFDKNLGRPVISSNGKYIVRLNFNGCWRKVTIDDRLPLSDTRMLHVVDRRQPSLLWPALLEKAYLKVRGGYDFPGSNSCSDLWTLTGWIPEQVHLQESDVVPDELWNRIYKAFAYGDVLVTLGTGQMSNRQSRELGLEGQHSYVVLDVKDTDQDRLFLVKNPWVEGRGWRGPRPSTGPLFKSSPTSDGSKNSLEAYHQDSLPSVDQPHPTTFWIGLEQVVRHFESLYLNWNPGLFRYRQDIHFEWLTDDLDGNTPCLVAHPQFSFHSKHADNVWFLLTRHFRDAPAGSKEDSDAFNDGSVRADNQMDTSGDAMKGYMSIFVCDGKGERLYIKESYLESADYVTTPQCLLRWKSEADMTHTVIVDQDELPPSLYTFSLSVFSNSEIDLEPAVHRYPIQKVVTGEWTKQTAGGSINSSRYFENPQYTLEVKERVSLAILLTSTSQKNPLHVKLTLGYGKRIYRLQSRDVLADSGDHRVRCVLAETEDLQPGLYTIICSLFEPGQVGEYTLRVDSTKEVTLKQIPRDGAGLLVMKLGLACFRADVHEVVAPIHPRYLAKYTIVVRFLRATTPRALGLLPATRSPMRFSIEVGRGPERKFLVASEDGQYADSATIRTDAIDIDPDLYSSGDLYLVLDRLSGPGGPVEEWYEVELYTDRPDACTVGVWRDRV